MGKNKLSKFGEMEGFPHVFQYPWARINTEQFPLKGSWRTNFFKNDHPIVLELGCGKGEYTVGLAECFPKMNFIGIDIKGARMFTGAKYSYQKGLENVAFLRTEIELLEHFFDRGEVDELWITFPDPQMKKVSKRLTGTSFVSRYLRILKPNGVIHLKTDSLFLYTYTKAMIELNGFVLRDQSENLYEREELDRVLRIKTYYEEQWMARGIDIKYLEFVPEAKEAGLKEPDIEIAFDDYRSFGRSARTKLNVEHTNR